MRSCYSKENAQVSSSKKAYESSYSEVVTVSLNLLLLLQKCKNAVQAHLPMHNQHSHCSNKYCVFTLLII